MLDKMPLILNFFKFFDKGYHTNLFIIIANIVTKILLLLLK